MAEEKTKTLEREYIVPLRREFLKVPQYRRAGRAAKALKQFIAKHMKVEDRNVDNVRLDKYLNNELWFRGKTNPPAKIKVKAIKEGDIVRVELVEISEHVKFLKAKHAKFHQEGEKKEQAKEIKEESKEEKAEEKKAETEKEKSVEQEHAKEGKMKEKEHKHLTNVKETPIQRKALNRH